MSATQEKEKYAADTQGEYIRNWYFTVARTIGAAYAGMGQLKDGGVENWALLQEVQTLLWGVEGDLYALTRFLLTKVDAEKAKYYQAYLAEAVKRPGRLRPAKTLDSRPRGFLRAREILEDRMYALELQTDKTRDIMAANQWFEKGFSGHRESPMSF